MNDLELHPSILVRLSAQRALLGAVPPSLRLVTASVAGTAVQMCFVFDGQIAEDDVESARMVTTEIISNFPAPWTLEEKFIRLDYPAELDDYPYATRVYERKERTTEGTPFR